MPRDRTFCRICEAACGLQVVRDPAGTVAGLRPDREHPLSKGFVCAKGTRFLEVARDPSRLLRPVVDGRKTSWSSAIESTGTRIRRVIDEHGPHAVGIYFGNPLAFNALGLIATIGLANQIGTRNLFFSGSQDCNNKFAGSRIVYGSEFVHPIPDFERTDLAVVFGSNPYVSQSSFVHLEGGSTRAFGGIMDRGGSVVWVDPRRTESAKRWGEHLPIRPGSDAWLMLGLLQCLGGAAPRHQNVEGAEEMLAAASAIPLSLVSERTGIPVAAISGLAGRIAASKRTVFHMSVGVNQGGFGTLAYALLQGLAFVTGNLDREGGSVFSGLADPIDRLARWGGLGQQFESRVGNFPSTLRTLPAGIMADEICEDGPERIRAMLVVAGDPIRSIPGSGRLEEAFAKLDFLACVDMFSGATAEHADVLLPAASWLERWDIAASAVPFTHSPLIQASGPVMPSPGDARPDAEIIAELARALGLDNFAWKMARRGLDRWLPAPKFGFPAPRAKPGRYLPRHRVKLWAAPLAQELTRLRAQSDSSGFVLMGRRRRLGHNSWLHGGTRAAPKESQAWMNREDAERLGVADGETIALTTVAATLHIEVALKDEVAPKTIVVPHGLPELNLNALIPSGAEAIERISGQHVMTGVAVEVRAERRAGAPLEQTSATRG